MKRKFVIWIAISILTTIIYSLITEIFSGNDIVYNLGKLFIPVVATLLIPMLVGVIVTGFAFFFTKKLSIVFSRTVWIFQILMVALLFISALGQNVVANDKKYKLETESENVISNQYVEFKIPKQWKYKEMQLIQGQLYNILCYFDNGSIRMSSVLNNNNMSHIDYYNSYKNLLFEDMKTKTDNLKILEEKSIQFLSTDAIVVKSESQYKGHLIYSETICFSKNKQMIIISTTVDDKSYNNVFSKVLETLVVKKI